MAFISRLGDGTLACMMTMGSAVKRRILRSHSCSIASCTGLALTLWLERKTSVV